MWRHHRFISPPFTRPILCICVCRHICNLVLSYSLWHEFQIVISELCAGLPSETSALSGLCHMRIRTCHIFGNCCRFWHWWIFRRPGHSDPPWPVHIIRVLIHLVIQSLTQYFADIVNSVGYYVMEPQDPPVGTLAKRWLNAGTHWHNNSARSYSTCGVRMSWLAISCDPTGFRPMLSFCASIPWHWIPSVNIFHICSCTVVWGNGISICHNFDFCMFSIGAAPFPGSLIQAHV